MAVPKDATNLQNKLTPPSSTDWRLARRAAGNTTKLQNELARRDHYETTKRTRPPAVRRAHSAPPSAGSVRSPTPSPLHVPSLTTPRCSHAGGIRQPYHPPPPAAARAAALSTRFR